MLYRLSYLGLFCCDRTGRIPYRSQSQLLTYGVKTVGRLADRSRAGDEIRTHDLLLGKETFYR